MSYSIQTYSIQAEYFEHLEERLKYVSINDHFSSLNIDPMKTVQTDPQGKRH